MNKKLQDKLFDKYPDIFEDRKLSMTKTCMCWGITTGDGWYKLIDALCDYIDWANKRWLKEHKIEATIKADQVKEKFGQLRFYHHLEVKDKKEGAKYDREYIDRIINNVDGAIELASQLSSLICEDCGSMESVTTNDKGYIRSLCAKCRKNKVLK